MYKHVVIDVLNCYWRNISVRKITRLKYQGEEIITSGILGTIESIRKFEKEFLFENGTLWLLFDNPDSIFKLRRDIDPEYKSNREALPEEFKIGIRILKEILKVYNDKYKIIAIDKTEADDLVFPLLERIKADKDILLISNDLDWARAMTDTIHWYNWEKVYYPENFKSEHGFSPEGNKIQMYKAFRGDKSDNIPNPFHDLSKGIDWKFSKEKLFAVLDICSDIDDFYKRLSELDLTAEWKSRMKLIESRVKLNYSLVDFMIKEYKDFDKHIFDCTFNKAQCKLWFKILNFLPEPRFIDFTSKDLFDYQVPERL